MTKKLINTSASFVKLIPKREGRVLSKMVKAHLKAK